MQSATEIKRQSLKGFEKFKFSTTLWWKKFGTPTLFLAPFLILMIIFIVMPVLISMYLSLTNFNMIQPAKWMGIANYRVLLTDDDIFLIALKNTFIFAGITGPLTYIMTFLAAWVIDQLKFRNAFALAFYAPSITNAIAMSVVWMMLFSSDRYGYINYALFHFGVITEPVLWTKDPAYILWVVIIIQVWMSMGSGFLVVLAGLRNLPPALFEAGSIDGIKNRFQELWYLIIPNVMPQLLFSAIMTIVSSLSVFDVPTQVAGMPSPNYSAHTIIAHLYDY
jgi:multiple sugar transport system permease protein